MTDVVVKNESLNSTTIGHIHTYYLSGSIEEASNYSGVFAAIRSTSENDIVIININSWGGDMYTTIQFLQVMADSPATIVASVEGACMSAATMIFLAADVQQITPHSMFMIHNYSGGTFGKGGEMYDNITHERSWSKALFEDIYSGFLTAEEIESVLDGKDLWLNHEQVEARLEVRKSIREELMEQLEREHEKKTKRKPKINTKSTPKTKPKAKRSKKNV